MFTIIRHIDSFTDVFRDFRMKMITSLMRPLFHRSTLLPTSARLMASQPDPFVMETLTGEDEGQYSSSRDFKQLFYLLTYLFMD